jgi:squalene cyclase
MSIDRLIGKQNPDGGWPHVRGKSWTEPTVYAVLALWSAGEKQAAGRGLAWLRAAQREDGGWSPQPGIDESNWTTGLVALLPPEAIGPKIHAEAIAWLMGTTGHETSFDYRLRQWLLGVPKLRQMEFAGWPWVPGTAAWVGPTSVAILALEKEYARRPLAGVRERIEEGRRFLLVRACDEGGWNHGSVGAFGYASKPYPETTGMALAALRGVRAPQVTAALAIARQFLADCRSADAQNWLRLGLSAHAALPPRYCVPEGLSFRTVPETSLELLLSGANTGEGVFWC